MKMKENKIAQKKLRDSAGRMHTYEYYVLVEERKIRREGYCKCYGVRIQERRGECSEVTNVTSNVERIDELINRLVRNGVTPCTLRDVVDDWL